MKEGELIKKFSNRLMDIVNQMRVYGEDLPDKKVVEKVMINVPQRFEANLSAIEESCDMMSLTIGDLVRKLEAQEQRISMRALEASEDAFLSAHKGLKSILEELVIIEDAENEETSDWFDVADTTDTEVIKIKSLASVKQVYRIKFNYDGIVFKHNVRLVVKGNAQIGGVDYGDTFAPVARLDTIRLFIVIAENSVQHGRGRHINVKFHAILEAKKNSLIKMDFCSSEMQVTDLMANGLSKNIILFLKHELSMSNINLKVEC
ncbi:hypothetical protein GQ457_06G015930 [Hibiscus cannabinus]